MATRILYSNPLTLNKSPKRCSPFSSTPPRVRKRRLRTFSEQQQTHKALTAARKNALHIADYQITKDRYIILSDVHKGDGHPISDDFHHNVGLYCTALRYYLHNDYRLILNGDIEECWKDNLFSVIDAYASTAFEWEHYFAIEGQNRYIRTYGNHDNDWADERKVDKYLKPALRQRQPVRVYPAVVLGHHICIAHGHQGDLTSDRISWFSRRVVRHVWRPAQLTFGLQKAKRIIANHPIRSSRDRYLHQWAAANHLLLIAGHTHRALFYPHPEEVNPAHHYINAGCCVHRDGLTGIEIDQGEIRLIKWIKGQSETGTRRTIFKSVDLMGLLARL